MSVNRAASRVRTLGRRWLRCASWVGLSGCASIEQIAPPVDETIVALAAVQEIDPDQLLSGRKIYLTQCARCHSPEPVARYSLKRWAAILPRMSDEAALSAQERADVRAYIEMVVMLPAAEGESEGR